MKIIKTLQTGNNINSIYSLLDLLIIKKYSNKKRSTREYNGLKTWTSYTGIATPKHYLKIGQFSIFKKIRKAKSLNAVDKKRLLPQVADIYANSVRQYQYHKETGEKHYQHWNIYLLWINSIFNQFRYDINYYVSASEFSLIKNSLCDINAIDWTSYAKLPLHRDLHWDNIIYSEDNLLIIDFEHFCIGPIEFEFCNSLFWNDSLSIDFISIVNLLEKRGINVNKQLAYKLTILYFIEQFHIARSLNDQQKIKLLIKQLRKFIGQNSSELVNNFTENSILSVQSTRNNELQNTKNLLDLSVCRLA